MNVKTLCLSILYESEATGYEIRRLCVEGECSYFVEASFGSIYPALAKLEAEGSVTSRIEQQTGKPAKKVYSITENGREAFREALFEPLGDEVFRSPFLLFARYAHLLPADLVHSRLEEHLARVRDGRRVLEEALEKHGSNASDLWVIRYGLAAVDTAQKYIEAHMHELVSLAQREKTERKAAE